MSWIVILAPFAGALLVPFVARSLGRALGLVCAFAPAVVFAYLFRTLLDLHALGGHSPARLGIIPWAPSLGLDLTFRLDGLGIAFGLLISGIGVLICLYASAYFRGDPRRGRFMAYLLFFMGAMLGVVLADNVFVLFVFWELTSIASYLLIGFEHDQEKSRSAALQALLTTGAGGLAMLAGLVLLGNAAGSYDLTVIIATPGLAEHPHYLAILLLILAGAATKSAQFPFHYWLPNAMAAPTPASAYLHSSTMVKGGVYLLARLSPALGGTELWFWSLAGLGGATMLAAGWLALRQTALKPMLAYSTVVALGTLVLCIGLGTPLSITAFKVFLFVHAFYKAALFMVAGSIIHETHETDFERLGGLGRLMPATAIGGLLAALSMAGLPPLLGFVGKESVYEAVLYAPLAVQVFVGVAVFANVANVYVAAAAGVLPFWRRRSAAVSGAVHEAPMGMWIGPVVLGGLGLAAGLYPFIFGKVLLAPGGGAVLGEGLEFKLKLWHGVNSAFLLSMLTLGIGLAAILARARWRRFAGLFGWLDRAGPEAAYRGALEGMLATARAQTAFLQHGYLRYYLLAVLVCVIAAVAGASQLEIRPLAFELVGIRFHEIITVVLVAVAALGTTRVDSRFGALACLGVVGYGIALLYVFYGAPDLAKTQIVVESLTVVFFALLAAAMPGFRVLSAPRVRRRDAMIAALAGGLMGVLVYSTLAVTQAQPVAQFYRENSYPLAHGRNVVNVILVDFRALDTLGEITVLAVAAFGAHALLRLRNLRRHRA
ncbi:MAG: DUF4040 domain-containing protein [Candidatus Hydrogenedentes bacterium]|nr:DUF4040 domain-containing protein [Candidatus Hydrogenedentota bacterium]